MEGLFNLLAEFESNDFKHTWIAKNRIFREDNLRVILNCDFNQYDFHLNVEIYQWSSKTLLCSGTVIRTLPDEVFFDHLFKDVYINMDRIIITEFLDYDFIQIDLFEALKGHFVYSFCKCPKHLDEDMWNDSIASLLEPVHF